MGVSEEIENGFSPAEVFLRCCDDATRTNLASCDPAEIESALELFIEKARSPWPDFSVSEDSFVTFVAERLGEVTAIKDSLSNVAATDLWLAYACLQQSALAQKQFDNLICEVAKYVGTNRDLSLPGRDDFLQQMRETLLVPKNAESQPKLAKYSGKGSLRVWTRVVLARDKVRFQIKKKKRESLSEALMDQTFLDDKQNPELNSLKNENAVIFHQALKESLEKLAEEDRLLLRYWLFDGMNFGQIAHALDIHRLTVSRRLNKIRVRMMAYMRRALSERLRLCKSEMESLIRNIESHLDASISALF